MRIRLATLVRSSFACALLAGGALSSPPAADFEGTRPRRAVSFEGEKTTWHEGFDRFDYVLDEATLAITPFHRDADERFGVKTAAPGQRRCIIVAPRHAAAGNPWSWQGCYWDHQPQAEVELLRR